MRGYAAPDQGIQGDVRDYKDDTRLGWIAFPVVLALPCFGWGACADTPQNSPWSAQTPYHGCLPSLALALHPWSGNLGIVMKIARS